MGEDVHHPGRGVSGTTRLRRMARAHSRCPGTTGKRHDGTGMRDPPGTIKRRNRATSHMEIMAMVEAATPCPGHRHLQPLGISSMKIILSSHMGMCFGVRDAIALALESSRSAPLTIFGELVHNETVNQTLTE